MRTTLTVLAALAAALVLTGAGGRHWPESVRLGRIPDHARIVFHDGRFIYTMDARGRRITRITFENPRMWEHVAVSHDRTQIAGATPVDGTVQLWVLDLERGTERRLVPEFAIAGNGGVDWDRRGFVYFAGVPARLADSPGANDVYRIRPDGTDLRRLTRTLDRGEADVSVSDEGTVVAFMATRIRAPNATEIWTMRSDGRRTRRVAVGGRNRVSSVHDPELSPDNRRVVFSRVNPHFRNFPEDPAANTAHDLWVVNADGTRLRRLTKPGPISIVPDWRGHEILYLELTDREQPPYLGLSLVRSDGTDHRRIRRGAGIGKWIP